MQKDLTRGNPFKVILQFAFPVFIGNLFQLFYSFADTAIVGHVLGEGALAAVGATGTISFLLFGFIIGMSVGFTVSTAQHFGAGELDKMRRSVASAILLSGVITLVLTLGTVLGMRGILTAMRTQADIFEDAYAYIIVICGGMFAQVLYNLLSSILRALGNSKASLYFLIIAAVLNIVLDLVFVMGLHMGTAGAAYATVISQGVSGVLCLVYILKKVPILHLKKEDWKPDFHLVANQLRVGCPMALQYTITAIGSTMVQVSLNLLKNSAYIAAFTAGGKLEQMVAQASVALGTALSTYVAQNSGAGKFHRVRQGFRATTLIGCSFSVVAGLLTAFLGKYTTYLFVTVDNPAIVDYVDIFLLCSSAFYIPLMIVTTYRNGIQGMGYGLLPMTAGLAELLGRFICSALGIYLASYTIICLSSGVAWVLASSLLVAMYFHVMKKHPASPEEA